MAKSQTQRAATATLLPMIVGLLMSPAAWCVDEPAVLRGTLQAASGEGRRAPAAQLRGSVHDDGDARDTASDQASQRGEIKRAEPGRTLPDWYSMTTLDAGDVPTPVSPLETGALGSSASREVSSSTSIGAQLGIGSTTNAGPTLARVPSMVVASSMEVAHLRRDGEQELSLDAAVEHREFASQGELSNYDYKLKAAWAGRILKDGRLSLGVGSEKRADVDEVLARSGGYLEYEWIRPVIRPFARISAYYLDYSSVLSGILADSEQDDRDRLSATALAGVKYQMSSELTAKLGLGSDVKLYNREPGLAATRNSHSLFPFAGLAYEAKNGRAEVLYAPVFRFYQAPQFDSVLAHTVTARGELKPDARLRLVGALRLGLEEADFLAAKAINECVISVGGIITTTGGASLGLEAAYTLKDYVGASRLDRKVEAVLRGRVPIGNGLFMTAEARYLDFRSSFAGAETDMLMGTVGIAYQTTR